METKRKILIVEDQPLLNNMLRDALSENFNVVATCTSANDMLPLCDKKKPDVVLTDVLTGNGANGIECGKLVKEKYGNKIKVLAITGIPEISFLNKAKEANLDGLIYKDIDTNTLLLSINQVLNGYNLFPGNYITTEKKIDFADLNDKEMKILLMLCDGKERKEIASEVGITLGTLKNYISNILTKANFDSISKITLFCVSNGYIIPNQK